MYTYIVRYSYVTHRALDTGVEHLDTKVEF